MIGIEKGIKWEITECKSPADILIYDLEGNLLYSEKYKWLYEPIFGMDYLDTERIDMILDKLIAHYGKKEEE